MYHRVVRKSKKRLAKKIWLNIFALGLLTTGLILVWAARLQLPDVNSFNTRVVSQSTKFFDRTGKILLFNIQENVRRSEVPLSEISPYLQKATVAIEDDTFYQHKGIRPLSFLRAVLVNATSLGFSQGGSTITQQVVKNSLLTRDKSIARKLKEWVLAIKLERVISKDQILEIYLNESPYGGNIYGAEEASHAFFGVSASSLNLPQSAYLASLPQAPSYYSPYGNHRDELTDRKNSVLGKMYENNLINETEYLSAQKEKVEFKPPQRIGIVAPHFVFYLRSILEEKYGKRALEEEGLKIITTIDVPMQQKAEEIVKKYALLNKGKFNAENAGLVALDPKTGQILAMVGSRDYFDKEIDGNVNVVLAKRQPGSSFKPFVYATAFKKGYTPDTMVFDLETEFSTRCDDESKPLYTSDDPETICYNPENYDQIFRGPVSLRNALAQSLNIPAVKVLYLSGMKDVLQTAEDVGINTLNDPDRYGLTLVLGGGEVTLLQLTGGYGALANDGIKSVPNGILLVENGSGEILESFEPQQNNALPSDVARIVSDILSDDKARSPLFGERSTLYFPDHQVAAKTGTTNDYRDAWVVGYTPSLAVGSWAGNNDNRPMEKKVAGQIVAPMWHEFMVYAISTLPDERFHQAAPINTDGLSPVLRGIWQGGETYFVDKYTGVIVDKNYPEEKLQEKIVPSVHSILKWINKNDPQNGIPPSDPNEDSQFSHWEFAVRKWAVANGYGTDAIKPNIFSTAPLSEVSFDVIGYDEKSEHAPSSPISFTVVSAGSSRLSKVEIFLNNNLIGIYKNSPFYVSFNNREIAGIIREENLLKIIGYNASGLKVERFFPLNFKLN
ncbi:MAG: transglycosylase domain-containing protein [Patescibacteria group bacterium]